jgi:phage FluMu protein Com
MHFRIFRCQKCGQYLYIREDQKTKKCPTCNYTNAHHKIFVLKTVDSVQEAVLAVQYFKLPENKRGDFEKMKAQLGQRTSQKRISKMALLGDLFSQLSAKFGNKIPLNALFLMCENNGFERVDIESILDKMYDEGLIMKTKNGCGEIIIKFVSTPFKYGQMIVK